MASIRRRGCIKKRGADSWLISLFTGFDVTGKRLDYTRTVRGTRKDAESALNDAVREHGRGMLVDNPSMTLNEFFKKWLTTSSQLKNSPRTSDGHESIYNRYFKDTIGMRKLEKLKPEDIQLVYRALHQRGLAAQTIKHAHAVLRCSLNQAVRWQDLARNPALFVETPKVYRKERRVLTAEESRRFIAECRLLQIGLVFEFAILTGMRPEEYLAIKWSDIDFARKSAQVNRALVRHKGGWTFREPKTHRSRRTIMLPPSLMHQLTLYKQTQTFQILKAANLWERNELVFCGEFGTPLSIPNLTYRHFRKILERAGLPQIRLYDLRHTHATLLLSANENPKVVSERLGHSTIVLTMDTYSHVLPTMQQAATDKLETMIFG